VLRNEPELEHIDPRYDPTVIIRPGGSSTKSAGQHLVAISSEDFSSKQPSEGVFWSSLDYHEAYKSGKLTPLQVVDALLPLIRRDVKGAKHSVAFLSSNIEIVLKAAKESTERYKAGKFLSPIDGVPVVCGDYTDKPGGN
jgi:hypothetical protein